MTAKWNIDDNVQVKKTVGSMYAGSVGVVVEVPTEQLPFYTVKFEFNDDDMLAFFEDELLNAKESA